MNRWSTATGSSWPRGRRRTGARPGRGPGDRHRPHGESRRRPGADRCARTSCDRRTPALRPHAAQRRPGPAAGGARRIAVATIAASLIAAMALGAAAFGGAFGGGPARRRARVAPPSVPPRPRPPQPRRWPSPSRPPGPRPPRPRRWSPGPVRSTSPTDTGRLTASVPGLASYVGSGDDTVDVVTDGTSVYLGSPALSSLTGGKPWLEADLPTGRRVARSIVTGRAVQPVAAHRPAVVGRRPGHDGGIRRPPRHPDDGVPDHRHAVRTRLAGRRRNRIRVGGRRTGRQGPRAAREHLGPGHGVGRHGRLPPPDLGLASTCPGPRSAVSPPT